MEMDDKIILGSAAAIVGVIQYLPYIRDILAGKTKPHAFSWFVWGLPCGIIFAAQLSEGAAAGAWATGVTTILCSVIFILSLYRGERSITRLDYICFLLALIALALWLITKDPLWSVILITAADVLGFIPTYIKSLNKPYEETLITYVIGGLKWVISIAALSSFNATTLIYPIAMVICTWLLAATLMIRRKQIAPPSF